VTTPTDTQQRPKPAQAEPDDRGWRLGRVVLLIGVLGLAVSALLFGGRTITLNNEKDTAVGQVQEQSKAKEDVADRAIAVCKGASAEELARLNAVGLCVAAADAKNQAPPVSASSPPFSIVRSAVDAYFAANPPKEGPPGPLPSDDVVLRFVKQVYDANKPADGRTPTDAELLTLIRQVYAANPPAAGQDGRNAFCYDNPSDAACQPKQGAQGVSVVDIALDGSDGTCQLVVTLLDPADGTTSQIRKPVNLPCGQSTPPSSDTPTPPETTASEAPPLPLPTS
jgi:hypothetical protein